MIRLFKLNKPEGVYIFFGMLAAMINGAINPVFSIVFSEFVSIYFQPKEQIMHDIVPWTLGKFLFC